MSLKLPLLIPPHARLACFGLPMWSVSSFCSIDLPSPCQGFSSVYGLEGFVCLAESLLSRKLGLSVSDVVLLVLKPIPHVFWSRAALDSEVDPCLETTRSEPPRKGKKRPQRPPGGHTTRPAHRMARTPAFLAAPAKGQYPKQPMGMRTGLPQRWKGGPSQSSVTPGVALSNRGLLTSARTPVTRILVTSCARERSSSLS